MAACESLQQQHIFENSLPEKPATLIESLSSWNPIMPPVNQQQSSSSSSFLEIFSELHFNPASDHHQPYSFPMSSSSLSSSSSSSLSSLLDLNINSKASNSFASMMSSENPLSSFMYPAGCHKKSKSFSSMNSESLQLCTEGLGFESFDDVEDMKNEMVVMTEEWQNQQEKASSSVVKSSQPRENLGRSEYRRTKSIGGGEFPPPISCIGKSGKPWVCFKSYRHDGRFVLKEIRMPTQEFLHACREDGRLKLQFVQPNDDIQELEEEFEEDEVELEEEEEEEDGSINDDGEEEREADTAKYEAENELQVQV